MLKQRYVVPFEQLKTKWAIHVGMMNKAEDLQETFPFEG